MAKLKGKGKGSKVRTFYWRERTDGKPARAWGDFRFLGGQQEPLIAPGEAMATTDEATARRLFDQKLEEYRQHGAPSKTPKRLGSIGDAVDEFLEHRRLHTNLTENWLKQQEIIFGRAVRFFGKTRALRTITPENVLEWIANLRTTDNGRGGTLRGESLRKHIHTLAELFTWAGGRRQLVSPGYNPVSLLEKNERPLADPSPDVWLEVHDCARLLEAARTYPVKPCAKAPDRLHDPGMLIAYPLLATFAYTGGRADEVLGLDVADLLFDRKLIAFRPNQWRHGKKGKTAGATRFVPMFPRLEAILRDYLMGRHLELRLQFDTTLLFPSAQHGGRLVDLRKMIDRVCERAELPEKVYRCTAFRKTFATAALQLLDQGAPIAQRTVQGWMGHESGAMLEKVYGKLGQVRHRSEVLEYVVAVENGTGNGTGQVVSGGCVQAVTELEPAL